MAAVDYVRGVSGGSSAGAIAGTSVTVPAPTGVQSGDQLVVFIATRTPKLAWTDPAGWTLMEAPLAGNGEGRFYRAEYGTDVTGSSWTWVADPGDTSTQKWAFVCIALDGSQVGPFLVGDAQEETTSLATSHSTPQITTAEDAILVALFGDRRDSGTTWTWPAGWVEQADTRSDTGTNAASATGGVYDTTPAPPGTYSVTATASAGSSNAWGGILAFAVVTATTAQGSASGGHTWSGSASGSTTTSGSASGGRTSSGTASGSAEHQGTASGGTSWTGAASGQHDPSGSASGGHTWSGTAAGVTPATQGGSAGGGFTWSGSASGTTEHAGSASGSWATTGTATGSTEPGGSASGGHTWSGTASGTEGVPPPGTGSASGGHTWSGTAGGSTEHGGAASGSWTVTGSASGAQPIGPPEDVCITWEPLRTRTLSVELALRDLRANVTTRTLAATLEEC